MLPGGTGVQQKDLVFQFVNDSFRLRMQLLEDKNRVTEMATPMLLTANNEVSRLFVGENYPIVTGIATSTTLNQAQANTSGGPTIQYVPVGTTLLIAPSINADRTVTLRLLQQNSTVLTGGATIPVVTSTGGIISQPIDVVSTRLLSGTVVAKDGLMLAVGGLIEETVTDKRSEVPILGRIPGLGFFFRRQETGRSRSELIIMIRPHVLSTPAESEAISKDLLSNLSVHPNAGDPSGTMKSFDPSDAVRPSLPASKQDSIFRFHSVSPADY
jgi:general secretion pathway protein D